MPGVAPWGLRMCTTWLVPRAKLGKLGGTAVPWDQGNHGGLWGSAPHHCLLQSGVGILWLQEGWGQDTRGGLAPGGDASQYTGMQGCGDDRVQGECPEGRGASWGAVWLAGHGGFWHGEGLAGVQVPCAGLHCCSMGRSPWPPP